MELTDYEPTLEAVKMKGENLILANERQPDLGQQIRMQLSNLEDSYLSLQATAEQIKVSPP